MRLILLLLALLSVPAWGQNPYVVLLPDDLKSRQLELIAYLRAKPGFKADIEKVFLDTKPAVDADTFPRDGNSDGQVSVDEVKRQIMRLPSNREEFGGKLAALQDAARGKILGWESKYPDGRQGDGVYDLNSAIKLKMQELGAQYSEELGRIARHSEDYRKHVLANGSDPRFLPQFDPDSPENRKYIRSVLREKEAEFNEYVRTSSREERRLSQKPMGPAELLRYAWHLTTLDPSVMRQE